ncbi:transcription/translation regulatory transformer protein RfaH [Gammaproteobacteria bacterium LSUCC0112]|nr:transcription/translation regulatory transformer protein RfaH [Gammaproteobacteria bacterium LSUCC0112]
MSTVSDMNWYLLQCKPNQQTRAEEHLINQGFEIYSPEIRAERIIRRQRIVRVEAVFPGYVFIRLNPASNWRALHATRGVSRLVSFNGSPHIVPDDLVQSLQQQYSADQVPTALFRAGDRVQIMEGCFKHIDAIVKAVTSDERIIVLMTILHSEQMIAFPAGQLAKAG